MSGLILIAILLVIFAGVIYGYFTRSGSGIDEHPSDGLDGAPGAKGPSEVSGKDQGEISTLDTHGTR
jgi:flagellar basal body-associated protein FliL